MTKVDIIIPTYNRVEILPQALESVLEQSFSNWQCWVAEDGSTDSTRKVLQQFQRFGRFHYLPGHHVGHPAVPRNRAIIQGSAPYIAFLDDDDEWLPDKLEKQVDHVMQTPIRKEKLKNIIEYINKP